MKTKTNTLLIVITFIAYCIGLCNASAFYDPGTQRWLNRDPIQEKGGINLYQPVSNDPIQEIDPRGLLKLHDISQFLQNYTPMGGKCKNNSSEPEWVIIGDPGVWHKLNPGESTGPFEDCDGMTCAGGFYAVNGGIFGGEIASCDGPGPDKSRCAANRRWVPPPGHSGPDGKSPVQRGSEQGNTPPGYPYQAQ